MLGQTISHYRIIEKLGGGGMGVVYKAEDVKLGRFVALKFLPDEVAKDAQALSRFQREARAVAALNHPNVVTVYSVEELDNVYFITMELIEGQPLDHLISTNGLPTDRIIEIAGAIAEALAAAHEKGIVHRDLKPANVMVTHEGRVKVLDFGLAKEVGAENANDTTLTSAGCTQAGMVMGTPAYMSPEQVSGRPLDHRSDIFSFGVVLHEMAMGRRPFVGSSSAELISSILRDTPPSVTEARPELPSDLARVIRRCLEKDPRYRVQTARDLSNEFRDLARTTTRPTPLSTSPVRATVGADSGAARADEGFWVAVLPFKYTGSSADLKALAEGLSEEVITGLSRFSYLRVIARVSAAMHSSESGDVRVIGKELGAHYVMEGTLRQAGPKMRLAVHLVDATTGAHLWAENYERTFIPEAIFELQDTLVPRIVSTVAGMHGMLPQSMSETVRGRDPEQLNPYEAVLRSFGYFERATAEELAAARKGLEFAVRKAPAYSDAWAMLSLLCTQDYGQGFNLQPDSLQRGLAAARRAVETGPSNHLAYCAQAYARFFEKDFPNFQTAADRSVEINPMDATCLAEIGVMLVHAGFHERGLALAARARQLNPNYSGRYWWGDFHNAYRQRDYRAALDIAGKIELPKHWAAMCMLAAAGQLGDRSVAEKALQEVRSFPSDFVTRVRNEGRKWMSPEMTEHFIEGLRKAGLQIASEGKSAP